MHITRVRGKHICPYCLQKKDVLYIDNDDYSASTTICQECLKNTLIKRGRSELSWQHKIELSTEMIKD
jgi:hypothetical protein